MRPKSVNSDLPPHMIRQKGTNKKGKEWVAYYYYTNVNGKRKKIPLGSDLAIALHKWAEIKGMTSPVKAFKPNSFGAIAPKYVKEILPTKAPQTQKDYKKVFRETVVSFY